MRKGIVTMILIFSIIQVVGLVSIKLVFEMYLQEIITDKPVRIVLLICSHVSYTVLTFILLGFYLNIKYKNLVTYWRFVLVGSIVSVITSFIFYFIASLIKAMETENFSFFDNAFSLFNISIPIVTAIALFLECLIVAIFHKKFKTKKRLFINGELLNKDSLDSNIVNDEQSF